LSVFLVYHFIVIIVFRYTLLHCFDTVDIWIVKVSLSKP